MARNGALFFDETNGESGWSQNSPTRQACRGYTGWRPNAFLCHYSAIRPYTRVVVYELEVSVALHLFDPEGNEVSVVYSISS